MDSSLTSHLSTSTNKAKSTAKFCNFLASCGKLDEVKSLVKDCETEDEFISNLDVEVMRMLIKKDTKDTVNTPKECHARYLLGNVVQALIDVSTGYSVGLHQFVESSERYNINTKFENYETWVNLYEGTEVGKPSPVVKVFGPMIRSKLHRWDMLNDVKSYSFYPLGKNRVIVENAKCEILYQITSDDGKYYSPHRAQDLLNMLPPNIKTKVEESLKTQPKDVWRTFLDC